MRRLIILLALFMNTSAFAGEECDPCLKGCYDKGFVFSNDWISLKVNACMQADARIFTDWSPRDNDFYIRRARLLLSGKVYQDWVYRFTMAFEGANASLYEGWLEYGKFDWMKPRVGEFRMPFCMEAMHSALWLQFIERGLGPTNISPFEDLGAQVAGVLWGERVNYAVGVYNGQGRNTSDTDNDKEVTARVFVQPFLCCECHPLQQWTFGGSISTGRDFENVAGETYRTAARTPFVTFAPLTWEDGTRLRWGAESELVWNSWIAQGEYLVYKRAGIQDAVAVDTVESQAWYASLSYVLTGECKKSNAPICPCNLFDPCKCRWGAWEVGVRYEEFKTEESAFVNGLITGAEKVSAWTGGLNWTPNEHVRIMLNYIYTDFHEDIAVDTSLIDHEHALLLRFQWSF